MTVLEAPGRTLEEQGTEVRRLIGEATASARSELTHCMDAGDVLLDVRRQFPKRAAGWRGWLEESRPPHYTLYSWVTKINCCIRLALHREVVEASGATSYSAAVKALRGVANHREGTDPAAKAEALYLRGLGLTYEEVAEAVGYDPGTILGWCNPESARRKRERALARDARRRAERKALDREKRSEAVRSLPKGAAPGEAYNGFRKYGAFLDQAIREATSRDARAKYEAAYSKFSELTELIADGVRIDSAPEAKRPE